MPMPQQSVHHANWIQTSEAGWQSYLKRCLGRCVEREVERDPKAAQLALARTDGATVSTEYRSRDRKAEPHAGSPRPGFIGAIEWLEELLDFDL